MAQRTGLPYLRLLIALFLVILVVLLGWYSKKELAKSGEGNTEIATAQPHEFLGQVMGTNYRAVFYEDKATNEHAWTIVTRVFKEVDDRFSTWKDSSELSQLNAKAFAEPVPCSDELWELLQHSREAFELSEGGFDISAGPLMHLWGFYRKRQTLPSNEDLAAAVAKVGLQKVIFDDTAKTVRFTVDGMSLDVGGIAKGWAVDLAVAELRQELQLKRGLVDLGGNIFVLGEPPPGKTHYTIGIRNPRQPRDDQQRMAEIGMLNQAVATSGDYERFVEIDGHRYGHIMNPRTGQPASETAAVSVVAPSGLLSDILSTTILVNGGRHLDRYLAAEPRLSILVVQVGPAGQLSTQLVGPGWNNVRNP
jgi:FAD:protein FMN transferase